MSTFKLFTLGLALPLGLAAQMATAAPMAQADADAIFAALDADRNGQVTTEELARMPEARFAAQDTNGDGILDAQELSASLQALTEQRGYLGAIQESGHRALVDLIADMPPERRAALADELAEGRRR